MQGVTQSQAASDTSEHAGRVAELFRAHNAALIAVLQSRLDSFAEAQEVAQEAYVRLLRLEHPEQVGFLRAYLFQIAGNLATDRLRNRSVSTSVSKPDLFERLDAPSPDRRALATDQLRAVREALRELPAKTSHAFLLHVVKGESFAVIAQQMQLGERMVRMHVARALAHCRARVDGQED